MQKKPAALLTKRIVCIVIFLRDTNSLVHSNKDIQNTPNHICKHIKQLHKSTYSSQNKTNSKVRESPSAESLPVMKRDTSIVCSSFHKTFPLYVFCQLCKIIECLLTSIRESEWRLKCLVANCLTLLLNRAFRRRSDALSC